MGPTWVLPAPNGPHVGPMNLAIRVALLSDNNSSSRYPMDMDGFLYQFALDCVGVYEVITGVCNRLSVWLIYCQTKWCKITDHNFKCNLSMKIGLLWYFFHGSLFLGEWVIKSHHWFRWGLGAKQVTSHYLNQWWPSPAMYMCSTMVRWVYTLRPRQNGRHFPDDIFKCIFLNGNV